jgi:hypothetical protein
VERETLVRRKIGSLIEGVRRRKVEIRGETGKMINSQF